MMSSFQCDKLRVNICGCVFFPGEEKNVFQKADLCVCVLCMEEISPAEMRENSCPHQTMHLWVLPNSSCSPWMKQIVKHKVALESRQKNRNAYQTPACLCSGQQPTGWAILGRSERQRQDWVKVTWSLLQRRGPSCSPWYCFISDLLTAAFAING